MPKSQNKLDGGALVWRRLTGMLFESLDSCVSHFRDAEVSNMSLLADFHTKATSRAARLPGFKRTYNACIWGQASNHMLLQPTIGKPGKKCRCTIEEKFLPYFASLIQSKWESFLGALFGQNPETYQGIKPTWAEGLRFILDLKVIGFQSGLTPLQFANNLVFLGICQAPEPQEVADWISSNKSLGAYNGLVKLGFVLTGYSSIVAAYMIVFHHLDVYLTDADKQALGFGALFVEHLLCKVGRWEYRLRLQKIDFSPMAARAVQAQTTTGWVAGLNASAPNYLAFPIPLTLDRTTLDATIKSCLVSETILDALPGIEFRISRLLISLLPSMYSFIFPPPSHLLHIWFRSMYNIFPLVSTIPSLGEMNLFASVISREVSGGFAASLTP